MKKLGMISVLVAITAIAIWQWPKPDAPLLSSNSAMPAMENLPDNFFDTQVNPVLTQRCVVCHACYDAPCQLKMSSPEGLARGASKEKVYEGTRLTAAQPNRMFLDAHSVDGWRERGFFDVLPTREDNNSLPTQSSVLAQMLLLKKQYPLPNTAHLGDSFDVSLSRQTNAQP